MPYFQDQTGALHYLSEQDIENGGESLLPVSSVQITDAAAGAIQSPPLTLVQAQAAQTATIDAAYSASVQQNVTFKTAGGVTKAFQADGSSQTLVMQATQGYNLAGAVPNGFYWVSADNTQVPFTLADLGGLYQAMLARGWAAFQKRQALKAEIAAASTVTQVQAISWN